MNNLKSFKEMNESVFDFMKNDNTLISNIEKELINTEKSLMLLSLYNSIENFEKFNDLSNKCISLIKRLSNRNVNVVKHVEKLYELLLNINRVKGWTAVIFSETIDKFNKMSMDLNLDYFILVSNNKKNK